MDVPETLYSQIPKHCVTKSRCFCSQTFESCISFSSWNTGAVWDVTNTILMTEMKKNRIKGVLLTCRIWPSGCIQWQTLLKKKTQPWKAFEVWQHWMQLVHFCSFVFLCCKKNLEQVGHEVSSGIWDDAWFVKPHSQTDCSTTTLDFIEFRFRLLRYTCANYSLCTFSNL